jgi:hypothetical protein
VGVVTRKELATTSTLQFIQSAAQPRLGQLESLRRPREAEFFREKHGRDQISDFKG